MKRIIESILILFLVSAGLPAFSQKEMHPNPAAAYVNFLGYKYEIRKGHDGAEYGICIFPDGSECNDFDFFRGLCGRQYSYCALKGCDIKTKTEDRGTYSVQYAVCSCMDSAGVVHDIPLLDFMEQHGDTLIKTNVAHPLKNQNWDRKKVNLK